MAMVVSPIRRVNSLPRLTLLTRDGVARLEVSRQRKLHVSCGAASRNHQSQRAAGRSADRKDEIPLIGRSLSNVAYLYLGNCSWAPDVDACDNGSIITSLDPKSGSTIVRLAKRG